MMDDLAIDVFFFFNDTATTEIYTLSLHDALPISMANLLGDVWSTGEPNWPAACALPGVKLHLYGKADPRPGRKMGHLTARSEEHTSELQSRQYLVCRLLLEKKKKTTLLSNYIQ